MKFTKMQGLGNDYVYISLFDEPVSDPAALARRVSDRHTGIGSDGLILVGPSTVADVRMHMFNADGSEGEMCGNGIRCVGKLAYDTGLVTSEQLTVETRAGIKTLWLNVADGDGAVGSGAASGGVSREGAAGDSAAGYRAADGTTKVRVSSVRVDMGTPVLTAADIPVTLDGHQADTPVVAVPLTVDGVTWSITAVSMGNPHAVVFLDEGAGGGAGGVPHAAPAVDSDGVSVALADLDLPLVGPKFEHHSAFPNRVNTEFVEVLDRNTLRMRVWERGSGETMACGTGACAVAVAGVLTGRTERQVRVELLGGSLDIEWSATDDTVYMTGPATTVFTGELLIGEPLTGELPSDER
ncbi:MAG: diaminopimelate epimerase [Cellulomonadaceae bacterium]|nr:diaminopimelate epimerase [Cellulomonadaceae bacterium]